VDDFVDDSVPSSRVRPLITRLLQSIALEALVGDVPIRSTCTIGASFQPGMMLVCRVTASQATDTRAINFKKSSQRPGDASIARRILGIEFLTLR
jgi:hypothetical protein